jgi:hypothetical protein
MKVKALIDCIGIGYNLKTGDTAELDKKLGNKLVSFGYVEEEVASKPKETKVKK